MKKRLFAVLLAVLMIASLSTVSAFAAGETPTAITAEMTELQTGSYILNEDVTLTHGALTVPSGANVTLDLNGHKLTNADGYDTISVKIDGTLTVNGTGTVDNVSHARAAVYNNGTVTLNGGTYDRSQENGINTESSGGNSWYTICNHGTLTINDDVSVTTAGGGNNLSTKGRFSSLVENGYYSFGRGNERSGYVSGTNKEYPELTINGGNFTGGLNTIKNDDNGIVTIANGNFSNFYQCVILNHNNATVTGGTFVATNDSANTDTTYGVYNCGCDDTHDVGELEITGGNFSGADFAVADVSTECGSIDISGGNFTGIRGAIRINQNPKAVISITGGTFSSNVSDYVPTNYECADNDNGTYTVSKLDDKLVVKPGTDGSATLEGDFGAGGTIEDSTGGDSDIEGDSVTVDMKTDDNNDSATLTVTHETAQSLEAASSLTVKTDAGTVTLDSTALDKVSKTEADVEITIKKTESTDTNVAAAYTISVTASNTDLLPDGEINGTITILRPPARRHKC